MTDQFTVAVRALWDGTQLEAGTTTAAASVDKLADAVDSSSADVTSSLQAMGTAAETEFNQTLPAAADTSAVSLTTKAGKFKAVGTELGETVAQGVGSGMTGAEQLANIGTSLTSLLAPFAATGAGAIAAIGLGAGAALITNLIKGVQQNRQDFVDEVNEAFDSVEVHAKDSMREIREAVIESLDFKTLLEKVGGGSSTLGLEKIRAAAENLQVPFNELVDILRGDITPANRDTLAALREQSKEIDYQTKAGGVVRTVMTDEAKAAKELLDYSQERTSAVREAATSAKAERDYMRDSKEVAKENAATAERNAAAQERAAAAAERQAAALERINRRNDGDKVQ